MSIFSRLLEVRLKESSGRVAQCPLSAISQRHDETLYASRDDKSTTPLLGTFADVAKASDFQACRELTAWYMPELTLSGCAR